ncbi:MAG TPA: DUF2470 domain-containing protein [Mycobacterium sp.]|nr:DUF2470 domain-containing protein [Mycobacterium sp.]
MPVPTAPTTAERAKSTCARADRAVLAVDRLDPFLVSIHDVLRDGSYVVTVPADRSATLPGTEAVLELTDFAPLPLREPVRSLVWISGRLLPMPPHDTLLRLAPASVVVADSTGAESVSVDAVTSARPDPFCAVESHWLRHIEADHRELVDLLASRLPGSLRRGRASLLSLDRYGLALRIETDEADHDVRLPFPKPVDDMAGLNQGIRILMGCPFLNGLRARRI